MNQLQSHGDQIVLTFFIEVKTTNYGIMHGTVVDGLVRIVLEEF